MSLRPMPARWFELLVARSDLARAVEALAATGAVELEQHEEPLARDHLPDFSARIDEYRQLARRYRPYWPVPNLEATGGPESLGQRLARGLARIHAWRDPADPVIDSLEASQAERSDLDLIADLLSAPPAPTALLAEVRASGPVLAAQLFVLPPDAEVPHGRTGLLYRELHTPAHRFALVVGTPAALAIIEQEFLGLKARSVRVPAWVGGPQTLTRLRERREVLDRAIAKTRAQLDALARQFDLPAALADLARVEWFLEHVGRLPVSENFAWVSGWTDDPDGHRLSAALNAASVRAVRHFPHPPPDKTPPIVMRNPPWVRPFELFARLLGTPGRNEADPSMLLALIAPLLFGYMFGDIGQGFVLCLIGLWVRKRIPTLRLLVPGGIASMVFGLLFGSVFNMEWVPALWLRPLEQPLTVLAVPMAGGILILLLGLALNTFEAVWRGEFARWLRSDAALLVLYISALLLFVDRAFYWLLLFALVWYLLGGLFGARSPLAGLGHALQELFESALQLSVNTLSFSRVGAFALAHAGLGLAVTQLADSTGSIIGYALVLVAGNVIVIALEGLVVAIQTTRLILFEFFIRFYHGEGRTFRPLTAPVGR